MPFLAYSATITIGKDQHMPFFAQLDRQIAVFADDIVDTQTKSNQWKMVCKHCQWLSSAVARLHTQTKCNQWKMV